MKPEEVNALRSIAEKLRGFETEISGLAAMIPRESGGRLRGEQQREAQARLEKLKKELHEEAHRRDFSPLEKIFYERSIFQVAAQLTLRTNSVPDHRWFDKLYEAESTLSYARHGVEEKLASLQ